MLWWCALFCHLQTVVVCSLCSHAVQNGCTPGECSKVSEPTSVCFNLVFIFFACCMCVCALCLCVCIFVCVLRYVSL